jgi:hypothetical protein
VGFFEPSSDDMPLSISCSQSLTKSRMACASCGYGVSTGWRKSPIAARLEDIQ